MTDLMFSWAPTLLTVAGFSVAQASRSLAVFNTGGVAAVSGGASLFFGAIDGAMAVACAALPLVRRHTAPAAQQAARVADPRISVA